MTTWRRIVRQIRCDDLDVETPEPSWHHRLLMEALAVVAAPARAQAAWLERHGVVTDEIALDFEHACRLAEGLVEAGLLSSDALPDLRAIDSIFEQMTIDKSSNRWAIAALAGDAGWIRARELAQQALAREGADDSALPDIRVVR
ncbi:hypothetical protein [Kitasatospora sp. NPDC047058]|uniref:hypothetical protein n=1 Tax=Kitasatospora sp. NPDC047058 TaxID=3155620 RepID=UPI0033E9C93C